MSGEYLLSKLTIPNQQWYIDMEALGVPDLGQYYLALQDVDKTPKWVFQPEQYGDNIFSIQFFSPIKPQIGNAFAQVQAEGFNREHKIERRAMATMHASSATTLEATSWPDDWTASNSKTPLPVDSRMFNLVTKESGNVTIESILYKGYFVAVDKTAFMVDIPGKDVFVPALLSTNPGKINPTDSDIVPVEFKGVKEWYPALNCIASSE